MLQSFTLAALALADVITIAQLVAAQLACKAWSTPGTCPARQAFAVEMVEDRDDLSNAIALSSSMMHTARLVGPAVAGYLIYAFGEGYCFLIDGFSYLAVIAALLAMRLPRSQPAAAADCGPLAAVSRRAALRLRLSRRSARCSCMVAVTSLVAMSQSTLMPIFAATVLGGGERTLGCLAGLGRLGALVGSLYLASRRSVVGLGRVIAMVVRRAGRRTDPVFALAVARVLVAAAGGDRLFHGRRGGLVQHRAADDRPRRQARPRDGAVHDGVSGRGAAGQPAGRRRRHADRRAS